MSDPDPGSPSTPAKARLTEQEKRSNHIASEKKRREAIRAGFDRLAEIVPEQSGNGRSEAVVLQATVAYTKELIARKDAIKRVATERGWDPKAVEDVYRQAEVVIRKRESEAESSVSTAAAAAAAGTNQQNQQGSTGV